MKPLILLVGVFLVGVIIKLVLRHSVTYSFLGRLAMSCMLIFTGVSHFIFTDGMAMMLPDWVPGRHSLVYFTGITELMAAIGLLYNRFKKLTGILLIVFLLGTLPANVHAAVNNIDPLTGKGDGPGLEYLFFRIPLQLFFIGWVYFSSVYKTKTKTIS